MVQYGTNYYELYVSNVAQFEGSVARAKERTRWLCSHHEQRQSIRILPKVRQTAAIASQRLSAAKNREKGPQAA